MERNTRLERYRFERFVLDVAIATLESGGAAATLDTYSLLPPTDVWQFPKHPAQTVILPATAELASCLTAFIRDNEARLREPDTLLGTWINPQTGEFYLDISTSRDTLDEARRVARKLSTSAGRQIVALYNPKRDQTVFL